MCDLLMAAPGSENCLPLFLTPPTEQRGCRNVNSSLREKIELSIPREERERPPIIGMVWMERERERLRGRGIVRGKGKRKEGRKKPSSSSLHEDVIAAPNIEMDRSLSR